MLMKSTNTMATKPQMKNTAFMIHSIGRIFCFVAFMVNTGLSQTGLDSYRRSAPSEAKGALRAVDVRILNYSATGTAPAPAIRSEASVEVAQSTKA